MGEEHRTGDANEGDETMMVYFCTSEEEQQISDGFLEGHLPEVGHRIDWQFDSPKIRKGLYRIERVTWTLGVACIVRFWIVPVQ